MWSGSPDSAAQRVAGERDQSDVRIDSTAIFESGASDLAGSPLAPSESPPSHHPLVGSGGINHLWQPHLAGIEQSIMTSWHEHRYASPPKSPTPHFIVDILGLKNGNGHNVCPSSSSSPSPLSQLHQQPVLLSSRPLNLAYEADTSRSPTCSPLRTTPSHAHAFLNGKNPASPAHMATRNLNFDDEKGELAVVHSISTRMLPEVL